MTFFSTAAWNLLFLTTATAVILTPHAQGFSVPQDRSFVSLRTSFQRTPTLGGTTSIRSSQKRLNYSRASTNLKSSIPAFIDLPSALSTVSTICKTSPYLSAFVTCGIKAAAADIVAQSSQNKRIHEEQEVLARSPRFNGTFRRISNGGSIVLGGRSPSKQSAVVRGFDVKRVLAFLLYGSIYGGVAQQWLYSCLFPKWFGTGKSMSTVLSQSICNVFVIAPLVTFPVCYMTKALVFGQTLWQGIQRYMYDAKHHGVLNKHFMVWLPVNCIVFIMPQHLRVTFTALVSFFWLIAFSAISAKSEKRA